MKRNENLAFFGLGALCFLVLSSKHILLYNEELLVALSFLGFILFCSHTLTDTITESFQARSDAVQTEVEESLRLKENSLRELLDDHRLHLGFQSALREVSVFACSEMKILGTLREKTVHSVFSHQLVQKLRTLGGLTQKFHGNMQALVLAGFRPTVLSEFSRGKKTLQEKLLKQALVTMAGGRLRTS